MTMHPTTPQTPAVEPSVGAARRARFRYAPAVAQPAAQPLPFGVAANAYARYLPLFEPQRTDASCSVATATLVLNAQLAARGEGRRTQAWVVASDATGAWQRATANVN